jgi:hypothetical protein
MVVNNNPKPLPNSLTCNDATLPDPREFIAPLQHPQLPLLSPAGTAPPQPRLASAGRRTYLPGSSLWPSSNLLRHGLLLPHRPIVPTAGRNDAATLGEVPLFSIFSHIMCRLYLDWDCAACHAILLRGSIVRASCVPAAGAVGWRQSPLM